jgi:hypothetical protein
MSFPRGRGPWKRLPFRKENAAPDVGRGGAGTLFPINRNSLLLHGANSVNHYPLKFDGKVIRFPRRRQERKRFAQPHRLETSFITGRNPAPAADELKKLRGKLLVGEVQPGWGSAI